MIARKFSMEKSNPWQTQGLETEIINQEIALEKAEQRPQFNFLQFEYQGPHELDLKRRFALSFSISIPIKQKNYLKIKELEFKKQIRRQEIQADSANASRLIVIQKRELLQKIEAYEVFSAYLVKSTKLFKNIASLEDSPELDFINLLETKEELLNLQLENINYHSSILLDYIDWAHQNGLLYEEGFLSVVDK